MTDPVCGNMRESAYVLEQEALQKRFVQIQEEVQHARLDAGTARWLCIWQSLLQLEKSTNI